jgi:hypothetical protein
MFDLLHKNVNTKISMDFFIDNVLHFFNLKYDFDTNNGLLSK